MHRCHFSVSRFLIHAVVLAVGVFTAFHPTIVSGGQLLQTDPGDTLLNHYVLEHSWKWLSDNSYSASLWSPAFFYPAHGTLAYSENLLGTAPVYWLFRLLVGEVASFQLWMISMAALTYISMAWVLMKLRINTMLAALGAFVFAFGLPRVGQISHQQLLPAMFSPLAVYHFNQFLDAPKCASLFKSSAFTFLQLAASIYLGWFLVLGLVVFAVVTMLVDSNAVSRGVEFAKGHWRSSALVCVLFGIGIGFLMLPYFDANRGFHRSYSEVRLMLPSWHSWLSPPPSSWWASILPPYSGPAGQEHHLFPGAALLFLSGVVITGIMLRPERLSRLAATALLTGIILMFISLQFDKISTWRLVFRHVPGASGIRAVTRVFSIVYLVGWIGVLMFFVQWKPSSPRLANVGSAVLLIVGLAEQWQPNLPAFNPRPFFAETDRLAKQMGGAEVGFVEPDVGAAIWVNELSAMWAGLKADVPVVNGYSGRQPFGYPSSITGPNDLVKWLGTCQNVRVIGPARLAQAYPMPIEQYRPPQYLQAHRGD